MSEDLHAVSRMGRKMITAREIRADGYKGKNQWMVIHQDYGAVRVVAPSVVDAIWAAARYWKVDPRKAEFHQGCCVRKW